jgi:hypothetical protein
MVLKQRIISRLFFFREKQSDVESFLVNEYLSTDYVSLDSKMHSLGLPRVSAFLSRCH